LQRKISLYNKFDSLGFVAPSDWISDMAQRSFISKFPIRKIQNPLASAFLSQRSTRKQGATTKIRVGFAATNVLDPVKGFTDVAPLLEKIQKSRNLEILTAGRITVRDKHQYPYFRHLGPLPRSEIINFYDSLDVIIVPSKQEAAGMVALEAMSRGVIPIVSASGGLLESVGPDVGFVFSNVEDLEKIICGLSHESLDSLRAQGMRVAKKRNPLETARQYLQFASEIKA
jgi:glycosyltransferase involved in cell wall biosynthesis